jgi:6-pyruvoyltetrahydropterin/6-carboxytetrahydropterin synthase
LRYHNLDEHPAFDGVITSTEVLAGWVADQLARSALASEVDGIEVTLRESPDAWVSYRPEP